MDKKSSNFFEEHIEKMVLILAGLVCLWLFVSRVLFSPNYISYENKKFYPAEIDNYVSEQAVELSEKLAKKATPSRSYESKLNNFLNKVDSSVSDVDINIYPPMPPPTPRVEIVDSKYAVPGIGDVNNVSIEYIRTVAYIPTEEIDQEKEPGSRTDKTHFGNPHGQ